MGRSVALETFPGHSLTGSLHVFVGASSDWVHCGIGFLGFCSRGLGAAVFPSSEDSHPSWWNTWHAILSVNCRISHGLNFTCQKILLQAMFIQLCT